MTRRLKAGYIVSPRRKIKYGGVWRGAVKFRTGKQAANFIKRKHLKGAILYKVIPR